MWDKRSCHRRRRLLRRRLRITGRSTRVAGTGGDIGMIQMRSHLAMSE